MKQLKLSLTLVLFSCILFAQTDTTWNKKNCAVVLTYDDGLNIDINHVLPTLDSFQLKATFYISDYFNGLNAQIPQWKKAAAEGHELGNHTIWHPCNGRLPGRSFVTPDYDLTNYTVKRMENEILAMNNLLVAIDGENTRTFAYPCGDTKIHDTDYLAPLHKYFIAARGVTPAMQSIQQINLYNIGCYTMNGQSGKDMIELVKQAEQTHALLVFLFHGVGGEHSLNVSIGAHHELLQYLKAHENTIWVVPLKTIAAYIKEKQNKN
ncbi:MAG: polysaccharide deacetylase [Sphingobacteriales bacterium]|uniref:polysaccharide deacetylase family protein n=1 Tax=Hydrotalea flava TaxID=714549 RepID=UPI0008371A97|nr:polysaccharide deacetylase family protein [Hydrotalea flava]RTL55920.1 MAG: polysaccharide deacetylase [Sphingobacteriales bacterium]